MTLTIAAHIAVLLVATDMHILRAEAFDELPERIRIKGPVTQIVLDSIGNLMLSLDYIWR